MYFPLNIRLKNIKKLAENIYEPLYNFFNTPIFISSLFRNKTLNKLLGGSSTSQHCANKGAAIDLDAQVRNVITNRDIFDFIRDTLDYDQLIAEHIDSASDDPAWIHCSYISENDNRRIAMVSFLENGKTKYRRYKPEKGFDVNFYR